LLHVVYFTSLSILYTMLYTVKVLMYINLSIFRDNPNLCTDLFDADEIAAAINCICTE